MRYCSGLVGEGTLLKASSRWMMNFEWGFKRGKGSVVACIQVVMDGTKRSNGLYPASHIECDIPAYLSRRRVNWLMSKVRAEQDDGPYDAAHNRPRPKPIRQR